jgi:phosphatidylglycerol:prolipoprotein diacylglycerol transferase
VYPVLFRIGSFEVTSFGVLLGIAALVGIWLFGRELARSGLPAEASNAAMGGVVGGLIGAKVLWTIEFMGQQPLGSLLFSRGGLSWFGGLLGGVGTGLWLLRRYRVRLVRGFAAAILGIQAVLAVLFRGAPRTYSGGRINVGPAPPATLGRA